MSICSKLFCAPVSLYSLLQKMFFGIAGAYKSSGPVGIRLLAFFPDDDDAGDNDDEAAEHLDH